MSKLKSGDSLVSDVAFRNVIGHFASGVAVITCRLEGRDYGMTASAVSSVSMDPPTLLVCLNQATATQKAIVERQAFGVNILHDDQGDIARRFAVSGDDKFSGVATTEGPLGQPLLVDALATIECRVVSQTIGGTHRVFVAEVAHAEAHAGEPLAYYRGQFGHLMHAHELDVYENVRTRILEGDPEFQRDLTTVRISELLSVPPAAAYYALNRLAASGALQADAATGAYHARSRPMALGEAALDSRLALELGALSITSDRVTLDNLHELEMLASRVRQSMSTPGVSVTQREADHDAFHDRLVRLTGNEMLVEMFTRSTLRENPSGPISADEVDAVMATYEGILDGLREHSFDQLRAAMTEQYRLRKVIGRRASMGSFFMD